MVGAGTQEIRRIPLSSLVGMWNAFKHVPIIQCPKLLEISFSDIFDIQHHFSVHFGHGEVSKDVEAEDELQATALSVISVSVGALTMVGSKTLST